MKIKSLLTCNASLNVGGQRVTLIASPAILELDDKAHKAFIPRLKKLVAEGGAEWIKKPVLNEADQAKANAKALADAKALVAAADKADKAAK